MVAINGALGPRGENAGRFDAGTPAFTSYRIDVARRPRVPREAEHDLAERVKRGDRDAARRLIESSLSTVIAVALEYRRCGLPIDDLVQEGNIGLLKAVDHFDPTRGVRFATYAMYWVRAEIRDYVVRHYRVVRIGRSKAERRALWLYRKTREDRPEHLAAMSGLSTERAAELLPLLLSADVSLSPPPDGGPSLLERIADVDGSAEARLSDIEERKRLEAALANILGELSARDQDIVRRRLLTDEPATLQQIGLTWGISKERVRQLEETVKKRVRQKLEAQVPELGARPRPRQAKKAA